LERAVKAGILLYKRELANARAFFVAPYNKLLKSWLKNL